MNPYLEELLAHPVSLPTVPEVVREVMQTFSQQNVSVEALSRRIARDPVITAKLLRLANSAYYRVRREILSVDDALQMLGLTTVRNVVLGCGLKDIFTAVPGLDLRALWRHGVQTACAARWLARPLGQDAELAFTVALMLGIGQLYLHKASPERASQISKLVPLLAPERGAVELRALHFHFGDVAGALAQRWNLPPSLVRTLQAVPIPQHAEPPCPVAACVHLASWVTWREESLRCADTGSSGAYPQAVADSLALHAAWWPEILDPVAPPGLADFAAGRMPSVLELSAGLEELLD